MPVNSLRSFNSWLLSLVEHVGLLAIAIATVIAMGSEIATMINVHRVMLTDLLLLFLYLEVLTMVGLYYDTGKLPVRFVMYIGMVALTRYLIIDIKEMDNWRMVAISGSILLITSAVFLIRFGHSRYPYPGDETASKQSLLK